MTNNCMTDTTIVLTATGSGGTFPFALAGATGMYFASCSDSSDELKPKTETVATATGDNDANSNGNANSNNDDQMVTFRSCICTAACPIDIDIVSGGSVSLTICGDLNGTAGCTISNSNCTSSTYHARETTITASDCICVAPGAIFRVTNNGLASVTIDIIITGTAGPLPMQFTIPANSFRDYEVNASGDCDVAVIEC